MPLNPHTKGGADVPISDGGTGASDAATARSNLNALDETAHDALDHTGLTGVGDLTTIAHASLDHTGIMGVGGDAETESVTNSPGIGNDISRVVPANTLSVDGESLTWELWGVSSGVDTVTISFGGLTLVPGLAVDSGEEFMYRGTILRTGPMLANYATTFTPDGTGSVNLALTRTVTGSAPDFSTNLTLIAVDGSNNVTFQALIIRKWGA